MFPPLVLLSYSLGSDQLNWGLDQKKLHGSHRINKTQGAQMLVGSVDLPGVMKKKGDLETQS